MKVSEKEAKNLAEGMPVEIVREGSSSFSAPLTGNVTSISKADENGDVNIKIKLPDGEWKQNENITSRIISKSQNYNMCIPITSLRSDSNGYFVYCVEDKSTIMGSETTVVKIPVTLLSLGEKEAAIEAAIETGQRVLDTSSKPVKEGDRVRVKES